MKDTRESDYVDLHTHILPQMDDGSDGIYTSIMLLEQLSSQGVSSVCFSPHYYAQNESILHFCERRSAAFEELRQQGEMMRYFLAAEVAFFPKISQCRELDLLCIQGTKTLLLEMPFFEWNNYLVDEVISLVYDRNYYVIVVHPERFLFSDVNRKALQRLSELPIGFQVNADTIFRWKSRKMGLRLLQHSQIPLLGSDCHNLTTRAPHIGQAYEMIGKKLGSGFVKEINQNAREALGQSRVR